MKCANCGFENIDGAKFCQKCGLRITTSTMVKGVTGTDRTPNHSASATLTRCPKCGTERTGAGDGIHCTECDFMFSFPYPDASSSPTSVHYLPFSTESTISPPQSQKEPIYERRYISDSRRVSTAGGVILLFALLLLVVAWGWQEDVGSQMKNLEYPRNPSYYSELGDFLSQLSDYNSQLHDLAVSARDADRLWDLGVIIAVFGAAVVAFAQVRK